MILNAKVGNIAALSAATLVARAGHSPVLKLADTAGDQWAYEVRMLADFRGISKEITCRVTHTVLPSRTAGQITVSEENDGGGAKSTKPITTIYNADGTVARIVGKAVPSAAYRLAYLETIKLPDVPITPGLHWSNRATTTTEDGHLITTLTSYSAEAADSASGFAAWRIKFDSTESAEGSSPTEPLAKMWGTAWVRQSDGRLLGVDDRGKDLPIPGMDASVTVSRKVVSSYIPGSEKFAAPNGAVGSSVTKP